MSTNIQHSTFNSRQLNVGSPDEVGTGGLSEAGFTLLELLVVMALLGAIMTAIISLYIAGIQTSSEEDIRTTLTKQLTLSTDILTDDIRNAAAIEDTYSGYTTGSSTVILDLPAYDVNKNLLTSGTSFVMDRVVYTYSGGILKKYVFPDPTSSRPAVSNKTALNKISSLSFTYGSSPASASSQMSYTISVSDSFKSRVVTQNANETLILRNK